MIEIETFQPQDHFLKVVIYEASKAGKTTFGATAPKPVFASAEGGMLSVAKKNIPYVKITSFAKLQEFLKFLQTEKHGYESVIIDSITEINDIIKMEIEQRTGRAMQQNDWGDLSKKIESVFRGFRNLPMHTIFIAQESIEMDEGVVIKVVPSLNGKAATKICYFMDTVWYLYIDKTGERKIIVSPNSKFLTGDRSHVIKNNTEIDFSVWVELMKSIEIGEEKAPIVYEGNIEDEDEPPKPLPQPTKTAAKPAATDPMITQKTGTELFAVWGEMWDLSIEKLPTELDKAGTLKYTKEKSDPTRKMTMKSLFQVDSSTLLTEKQAKEMIKRCRDKIKELSKLPTPKVEKTIGRQVEELEEQLNILNLEFEVFNETPQDTEEFRAEKKAKRRAILDMEEQIDELKAKDPFRKVAAPAAPEVETTEAPVAETVSEPTAEEPIAPAEPSPVPPSAPKTPAPVPPSAANPTGKSTEEMVAELQAKKAASAATEAPATAEVAEAVFGE